MKSNKTNCSSIAVIALERFFDDASRLASALEADLFLYHNEIFEEVYASYDVLVALMSSGIAVRKVAPLLVDKWQDPALVVVSPDLKYAIPVLGGHHGGNEVAKRLGMLGLIPVISTASETKGVLSVEGIAREHTASVVNRSSTRTVNGAMLDGAKNGFPPFVQVLPPAVVLASPGVSVLVTSSPYVMGIGCRLGTTKDEIDAAIEAGCVRANISSSAITTYVTTIQKLHEAGLHEAVKNRGSLVFLDDATINAQQPRIKNSSNAYRLGLCGVCEPACLALSEHGELVLEKQVFGRVTIAIAR